MTQPRQIIFDEDAFGADQQLSTALLKDASEQVLWCGNERRNVACLAYLQMLSGAGKANRLPRLCSAQWACLGPFQFHVSPGTKSVDIILRFACIGEDVSLVAFSGVQPLTDAQMEAAEAERASQAATVSPGDTSVTLSVGVTREGRNDIWIGLKSARGATTATTGANITSALMYVDGRLRVVPDLTSAPSFDVVPEAWMQIASMDGDNSFDDSDYYTAAWFDSSSDAVAIAEDPYFGFLYEAGISGAGGGTDVRWGPLGTLQLESIAIDTTQADSMEGSGWFGALRWYQLPSAVQLRALGDRMMRTTRQRMPALCIGLDQPHNIDPSLGESGGMWRTYSGGFGPSTLSDPGYIAAVAWYSAQASTEYSGQFIEVYVPVAVVGGKVEGGSRYEVDVTLTAEVFAATDATFSTVLASSADTSTYTAEPYGERGSSRRYLTNSWIVQTSAARLATAGSTWALDGFTAPDDVRRQWRVAVLSIDVGSLASDTAYYVAVKGQSTQPPGNTIYAIGPIGMQVLDHG